jgi:hypothetical protein
MPFLVRRSFGHEKAAVPFAPGTAAWLVVELLGCWFV